MRDARGGVRQLLSAAMLDSRCRNPMTHLICASSWWLVICGEASNRGGSHEVAAPARSGGPRHVILPPVVPIEHLRGCQVGLKPCGPCCVGLCGRQWTNYELEEVVLFLNEFRKEVSTRLCLRLEHRGGPFAATLRVVDDPPFSPLGNQDRVLNLRPEQVVRIGSDAERVEVRSQRLTCRRYRSIHYSSVAEARSRHPSSAKVRVAAVWDKIPHARVRPVGSWPNETQVVPRLADHRLRSSRGGGGTCGRILRCRAPPPGSHCRGGAGGLRDRDSRGWRCRLPEEPRWRPRILAVGVHGYAYRVPNVH